MRDPGVPEVWAGVECSRVRVGRRIVDQLTLTGHDWRSSDLDLIAGLGISAVRYPVLWERIGARGLGAADWRWADERLHRLRELGLRPLVGLLHHGSGPRGISLLHPNFPRAFARYAGAVAARYPWIDAYLPINEPLTTARFGGLYGWWQPHGSTRETFVGMLLAQILAIRAAMKQIRRVNPQARLVVNEDVGRVFSTPELAAEAAYRNARRWLTWDLLLGRVDRTHPLYDRLATSVAARETLSSLAGDACPPDLLGVDHYVTSDRFLDHRPVAQVPATSDAGMRYVDVEAVRVAGVPDRSIRRAIDDTWQRYGRPLALTEVSLAGSAEDQVAWWQEAWQAAVDARRAGVGVRAVTAWSVFGAVDWHCMLRHTEGHYEPGCFDVRAAPPSPRPLVDAVRASASAARSAPGGAGARRSVVGQGDSIEVSRGAPARGRPSRSRRHERDATSPAIGLAASGWWSREDRFHVEGSG